MILKTMKKKNNMKKENIMKEFRSTEYNYEELRDAYYYKHFSDTPFYNEIKDLCKLYPYQRDNNPIKNWLHTAVVHERVSDLVVSEYGKYGYRQYPGFDPDCTTAVTSRLIQQLKQTEGLLISDATGRRITFLYENNKFEVETDTINSFWTSYKSGILFHYKNEVEGLTRNYNWLKFLIDNFDKFSLVNNHPAFIELGYLTHTLPNFAYVPKGYNRGRYPISNDYWDISLNNLIKNSAAGDNNNYKLYCDNLHLFYLEDSLSNLIHEDGSISAKPYSDKYTSDNKFTSFDDLVECVENMNNMICSRAKLIDSIFPKDLYKYYYNPFDHNAEQFERMTNFQVGLDQFALDPRREEYIKDLLGGLD